MARPVTRTFSVARNLVLVAGVVLVAGPTMKFMKDFAAADPFKKLMGGADQDSSFSMRMEGVQMKHFDKGKLVSYAKCDSAKLRQDHHTYDLEAVHDALYKNDQGSFRYSAGHAVVVEGANLVDANGGVHVTGKDMDLRAKGLQLQGDKHQLTVFGKVNGTIKGGKAEADNLVYHTDTGAYSAGPAKWKGTLAMNLQDPSGDDDKPHPWEIEGKHVDFSGSGGEIATYTDAVAADGEVILIAPNVVHNRKTDVVTATGRVQYFSGRVNLVADQCVVFRKEKRAVLTGNVEMLVKPKKSQNDKPKVEPLPAFQPMNPEQVLAKTYGKITDEDKKNAEKVRDSKTLREYPTVMVGDKIEYWYAKGSRRAVITGSPQARQELPDSEWRYVWTNVAYYDGEAETLKLVSAGDKKDTRTKTSVGDDFVADWLLVSTKEDDDTMSAHGPKGKFMAFDNDDLPSNKKGSGTPPDGKAPEKGVGTPPPTTGGDKKSPPPIPGTVRA